MESLLEEYDSLLKIDKYNLDIELESHAQVIAKVGVCYAESIQNRDFAKKELDVCYARLYYSIKNGTTQKLTEEGIKQAIELEMMYQEKMQMYLQAKYIADEWNSLKEALNVKGYMLRDMASLWISGYFADKPIKTTTPFDNAKQTMVRQLSAYQRKPLNN